MHKHKQTANSESTYQNVEGQPPFALENVLQLREAIDEVVYGETDEPTADDPARLRTVEGLTALGQMGLLTEMDLDEAKKGYLES